MALSVDENFDSFPALMIVNLSAVKSQPQPPYQQQHLAMLPLAAAILSHGYH